MLELDRKSKVRVSNVNGTKPPDHGTLNKPAFFVYFCLIIISIKGMLVTSDMIIHLNSVSWHNNKSATNEVYILQCFFGK